MRDGELVAAALAKAEQEAERSRPEIEQRLASISAEIARAEQALDRYYEAFEQGKLSAERCDERLSCGLGGSKTSAPRKPNSRRRAHTSPDTPRRQPISQPSPTNSNTSSPKASRRTQRPSSG